MTMTFLTLPGARAWLCCLAFALGGGAGLAAQQGGGGLRGPITAPSGGTITVDVGSNDATIEVTDASTGATTSHPVAPGKTTAIPVPALPAGSVILVSVGKGPNTEVIAIEIVERRP
jgi:hypothetical protein